MERILHSNTNQAKQAVYRGLTPLTDREESKFTVHLGETNIVSIRLVEGIAYSGLTLDKLFGKRRDGKRIEFVEWRLFLRNSVHV